MRTGKELSPQTNMAHQVLIVKIHKLTTPSHIPAQIKEKSYIQLR